MSYSYHPSTLKPVKSVKSSMHYLPLHDERSLKRMKSTQRSFESSSSRSNKQRKKKYSVDLSQIPQSPSDKSKKKGKGGSSCHQCKSRRNFTALTYCTSNLDKKNKNCRKKFCEHCLKKFYKESPNEIPDKSNWKCPSCRKICCCAACRRRKIREEGGQLSTVQNPPVISNTSKMVKSTVKVSHENNSANHRYSNTNSHPTNILSQLSNFDNHHSYTTPMSPDINNNSSFASNFQPFHNLNELHHLDENEDVSTDAEESEEDPERREAFAQHSSEVSILWNFSRTPKMQKHIDFILNRSDYSQYQKVQAIADILRNSLDKDKKSYK